MLSQATEGVVCVSPFKLSIADPPSRPGMPRAAAVHDPPSRWQLFAMRPWGRSRHAYQASHLVEETSNGAATRTERQSGASRRPRCAKASNDIGWGRRAASVWGRCSGPVRRSATSHPGRSRPSNAGPRAGRRVLDRRIRRSKEVWRPAGPGGGSVVHPTGSCRSAALDRTLRSVGRAVT